MWVYHWCFLNRYVGRYQYDIAACICMAYLFHDVIFYGLLL